MCPPPPPLVLHRTPGCAHFRVPELHGFVLLCLTWLVEADCSGAPAVMWVLLGVPPFSFCPGSEPPVGVLVPPPAVGSLHRVGELRSLHFPSHLIDTFLLIAEENTVRPPRGIETCGILAGGLTASGNLEVTTLVIPKQVCVACVMCATGWVGGWGGWGGGWVGGWERGQKTHLGHGPCPPPRF